MTSTPSTRIVFIGVPAEQEARIREMVDKVFQRAKDGKTHMRMVYETTVEEDMLNDMQTMHGGCAVYIIDFCSSVALIALAMALDKPPIYVTQTLNTSFHAPVPVGAKLEIVNTTLAFGGRIGSIATEIWDATNKRLCITGVHHQMVPAKPAAKL